MYTNNNRKMLFLWSCPAVTFSSTHISFFSSLTPTSSLIFPTAITLEPPTAYKGTCTQVVITQVGRLHCPNPVLWVSSLCSTVHPDPAQTD